LAADVFAELDSTIAERAANGTDTSYTRRLLSDRNLRLKKIGEEAAELVTACADGDKQRATEEGADLTYHVLVALRAVGASLTDLRAALAERMK
jgi:phosphoribosyl-ATP pyrophosphohydrolase/phosphoribosyl-AMP cyclohydrolase